MSPELTPLRPSGPSSTTRSWTRIAPSSWRPAILRRWRSRSTTEQASPYPTRWSRSGRPTPTAASTTRPTTVRTFPLDPETFSGFGRTGTDADGRFSFVTVKPGPAPGPDGNLQAHHVMVSVFARGLLKRLVTRVYFPDEEEANARDPVLSSIGDPAFRKTLVAHDEGDALRFDIHLQGENQTAFFEL